LFAICSSECITVIFFTFLSQLKQGKVGSKVVTDSFPSDKQAEYSKLKAELKKRELALISVSKE